MKKIILEKITNPFFLTFLITPFYFMDFDYEWYLDEDFLIPLLFVGILSFTICKKIDNFIGKYIKNNLMPTFYALLVIIALLFSYIEKYSDVDNLLGKLLLVVCVAATLTIAKFNKKGK